jgi:TPR repeat protein
MKKNLLLRLVFCSLCLCLMGAQPAGALDALADSPVVPNPQPSNADAQHRLAVKYANGDGVPVDMQKAAYWFGKAAEQGHARAQYNIGVMYARGDGVAQQYRQAASWYRKAADQGHVDAQRGLALLYAKGEGVPKDLERSYFWLLLASVDGDQDVVRVRKAVESQLTASQRAQAQTNARNWKPRT